MAEDLTQRETEEQQQQQAGCEDCFEDEDAVETSDSTADNASSRSNGVWADLAFAGWNTAKETGELASGMLNGVRNWFGGNEAPATKPAEKPAARVEKAESISDRIYSALTTGLQATVGWSIQDAPAARPAEAPQPAPESKPQAKTEARPERGAESSNGLYGSLVSLSRTFLPEQVVNAGTAAIGTVSTAVQSALVEAPAEVAPAPRAVDRTSSTSDLSSLYALAAPVTNLATGLYTAASVAARTVVGNDVADATERTAAAAAGGIAMAAVPFASAAIAAVSEPTRSVEVAPAPRPQAPSEQQQIQAAVALSTAFGGGITGAAITGVVTAAAVEATRPQPQQPASTSYGATVDALANVGSSMINVASSTAGSVWAAVSTAAPVEAPRPASKPTQSSSESASSWFGWATESRPEPKPETKPSTWASYGEQALRSVSTAAQEAGYTTLASVTNPENLKAAGDTIVQVLNQAAASKPAADSSAPIDSQPSKPVDRVNDTASFVGPPKPEVSAPKPETSSIGAGIQSAISAIDKPVQAPTPSTSTVDKPVTEAGPMPSVVNPTEAARPTSGTTAPEGTIVNPTQAPNALNPMSSVLPKDTTTAPAAAGGPGAAALDSTRPTAAAAGTTESSVGTNVPGNTNISGNTHILGNASVSESASTHSSITGSGTNIGGGSGLLAQLQSGNARPEGGSCSAPADLKMPSSAEGMLDALQHHNPPAAGECRPGETPAQHNEHDHPNHDHSHHDHAAHQHHSHGGGSDHLHTTGNNNDHHNFSPVHHPVGPDTTSTESRTTHAPSVPFSAVPTFARTTVVEPGVGHGPRAIDPSAISAIPGAKPATEVLASISGKPVTTDVSVIPTTARVPGELPTTFNVKVSELPVRLNQLDAAAFAAVLKGQIQVTENGRALRADNSTVRAELPGRTVEPGARVISTEGRATRVNSNNERGDRAVSQPTATRIDPVTGAVQTFRVVKGSESGIPGRTVDGQPTAIDGRAGRQVGPQNRYLIAELSLGLVLAAGGIRRVLPTDRNRNAKDGTSGTSSSGKAKPNERALVTAERRPSASERIVSRANERVFRTSVEKPAAAMPFRTNADRIAASIDRATIDRAAFNREMIMTQSAKSRATLPFSQPNHNLGKQVLADTANGISKAIRGFGLDQQPAMIPVLADGRSFLPRESILTGMQSSWRPILPPMMEETNDEQKDPDLFIEFNDPFTPIDGLTRLKKLPGTQGESLSRASGDDADEETSAQVLCRPTWLISEGETLVSIAEELFNDPYIAWLIADLNTTQSVEHWMDDKRIVEFSSRQQITLPVWQDIVEFYNKMPADARPERLVTIVKTTQLDREVVDSTLSKVMGTKVQSVGSITASVQNNEKVLT